MPLPRRANRLADEQAPGIREKILGILKSNKLVNGIVLLAIIVGFIHGWLKITFQHPAVTFFFDGLLCIALALTYFKKRNGPFFLRTRVGKALMAFYALCVVYMFVPGGPPLTIAVAALRGWCFASLIYCLGYHLTDTVTQIKGYFYVLVLLGVLTAIYGIRQDPEAIRQRMVKDPHFAERYRGIYYQTSSGAMEVRRFSTFVSAGVFGGVMAFVSVFAIVLFTDPREPKTERMLLMAALVPMCYGLVLSGARSALFMLGAGFATIAWYRRRFQTFILIPLVLLLALNYGMKKTGEGVTERYEKVLDRETVVMRMLIPTMLGWSAIQDNPIGYGLGKSGYSVPFFLVGRTSYTDWRTADGDLGALMIELGVAGLILFGRVLWAAGKTIYDTLIQLRGSPVSTIGLACAACVVIAIIIFPIGSPFLGIPTGALTWFFLGTLQKLADGTVAGATTAAPAPAVSPDKPAKRFLYYRPKKNQ